MNASTIIQLVTSLMLGVVAYSWYKEKQRRIMIELALAILKSKSGLGGIDEKLKQNREEFLKMQAKFNASTHDVPEHMYEFIGTKSPDLKYGKSPIETATEGLGSDPYKGFKGNNTKQ